MEFFTRDGVGTVMTSAPLAQLRDATIDDVGAILGLIEPLEADGTLVKRGANGWKWKSPLLGGGTRRRDRRLRRALSLLDGKVGGTGLPGRDARLSPQRLRRTVAQPHRGPRQKAQAEAPVRADHAHRALVHRARLRRNRRRRLPKARRELYNLQRRSKVLVKAL
jgi:amino-acid N-acetyltransferase